MYCTRIVYFSSEDEVLKYDKSYEDVRIVFMLKMGAWQLFFLIILMFYV